MRRAIVLLSVVVLSAPIPAFASTDPFLSVQWGLKRIGAQAAWSVTTGEGSVIAVIDTGVDRRHPDLKGRLLPGRDFADGDSDPTDDNGHGTLITGIVSASTGNGIGVASVAPGAKILPVRVLGEDGSGSSAAVADGIRWAVRSGADVINLSLAGEDARGGILPPSLLRDPSVDAAIREAARDGATVVVAAGNDKAGGTTQTSYDATVPGVVVVGSSTTNDRRAAYSNYGPGLDLLAPGGGSSSDPGDGGCTKDNSIVSVWWNPKTKESDYGGGCGTSMAVGFVSGVAAMLHAQGLTNEHVVERILATADDVGSKGVDGATGHGRLNAARAVGAALRQSSVRAAGSGHATGEPARARPSAAPRTEHRRPDASQARAPLAAGSAQSSQPRGAPRTAQTTIAALLISILVLAHCWRFLDGQRSASPRR